MALIDFVQEDASGESFNVACSGRSAGVTNAIFRALIAGDATPRNPSTLDPDNLGSLLACGSIECGAPGSGASWDSGDWTIPLNFTTGDAGTTLEEVWVCDYDGTSYTLVDEAQSLGLATNAGVQTVTVTQAGSHSPQSATLSRPFIVTILSNSDPHGGSSVAITPDQVINSPIDDGVSGVDLRVAMHNYRRLHQGWA